MNEDQIRIKKKKEEIDIFGFKGAIE